MNFADPVTIDQIYKMIITLLLDGSAICVKKLLALTNV